MIGMFMIVTTITTTILGFPVMSLSKPVLSEGNCALA